MVAGGLEHRRNLLRLPVTDLEYEETRASVEGDRLVEARTEQRVLGLVLQLGLQAVERLDVGRVRDDELPAFRGGLDIARPQLDGEPESPRILGRELERAEKIRTYNFPENRLTDHRIKLTVHQLDRILQGELDDFTEALNAEDRRLALSG